MNKPGCVALFEWTRKYARINKIKKKGKVIYTRYWIMIIVTENTNINRINLLLFDE